MVNVYAPQVFFIVFRECLEAIIVVSVLLSFLKQSLGGPTQDQAIYKRLVKQVWFGSIAGVAVCLVIGGTFIGVFYSVGRDIWSSTEQLWEGIFYLIATVIITAMGLALLRLNKTQEKWKVKLAQALMEQNKGKGTTRWKTWSKKYVMFFLPFITTLREGVEAVVFVGGVSLGYPATSFPLPVVTGILAAGVCGYFIWKGGNEISIRIFLIMASCVLYLMAAGMFSKAIWMFQYNTFANIVGGDVAESGNGNGSYNIRQTVWHVNCCNAETDNGWDVFNAILGWQNTATYGSVISYNVYWLFLIFCVGAMLYEEKHGSLPLVAPMQRFLLKVPLVNMYIRKKMAVSEEKKKEILQQSHAVLRDEVGRSSSTDAQVHDQGKGLHESVQAA